MTTMDSGYFLDAFVELAGKFQGTTWTDVDPALRDEVVSWVLRRAGFKFHRLVVKSLRGHFMDQDGSATGETYPVNRHCPLAVVSLVRWAFEPEREEDDYRATAWLDTAVASVMRGDGQAALRLASLCDEVRPMEPIPLTPFGDVLVQALDDRVKDEDLLWKKYLVHGLCSGYMDLYPCSDEWKVVVCRKCRLRVYVPADVSTFGDLRREAGRLRMA